MESNWDNLMTKQQNDEYNVFLRIIRFPSGCQTESVDYDYDDSILMRFNIIIRFGYFGDDDDDDLVGADL